MSLFGSSTNATSAGFSSGAPTYGGFGPPVGCGSFGVNVAPPPINTSTSRSHLWMENASEPFGRVENTSKCFARNGEKPTTSKWTPPKPPSHPLFQSVFHSNTVPLFGHSAEQKPKSLCVSSGGFAFGCGAPEPDAVVDASAGKSETMSLFGTCSKVGSGCGEPRTVFGSKSREAGGFTGGESRTACGLSASNKDPGRTVFGNASRCNEFGTGFGVGSTFAKPPLMPTSNPFAKSTQQLRTSSSNPFARTSVISSSNANPFEAQSSTFAVRVSANESVNPFAKPSGLPSNPFTEKKTPNVSVNHQNSSGSDKNLFAVPGSAWLTGQKSVGAAGSASLKFKSGLRPTFSIEASPWRTSTQKQQPVSSASFDWAVDSRKTSSMHQSHETTSQAPSIEAKNSSVRSSSSPANATPEALVASPDNDPYGSGSFGAGLVEQKIKTAIDNPPSSVELLVLGGRSEPALIPRQQPSARFASRLGLARQPLQVVPMRPVSRFPSHKRCTAPSIARSHLPQADPFCFSSSFSRLAISKKALRIKASGVSKPVVAVSGESDPSGEGSVADKEADVKVSPSRFCPVLRNKEYSTEPSMNELQQLSDDELSCVENFVISRRDCGKITFVGATDVCGLQLDELVTFSDGEIVVYPDDNEKPAVGIGLNKPAIVDLCGVSAEENESHENFLKRLELHTQKLGAIFLGYEDSKTGTSVVWKFRVEHF